MNDRTRQMLDQIKQRGRVPREALTGNGRVRVRLLVKQGKLRRVVEGGRVFYMGL